MRELFEGVSLAAFAAGNQRIVKAAKAGITKSKPEPCTHQSHKNDHAEHCASHPASKQDTAAADDAEHPFVTWAKRAGGTVAVLVLLWPMVGKWVPTVAGVGLGLWVIAALILGQPGAEAGAEEEFAEDDDEEVEEEPEQAPAATAPTPADARLAVAVLGAAGGHVALTAVTAHLASAHPLWKRSGKAVRALLQGAGVPVRGGVRVEGVSVPGVHRDDVPPLPSPSAVAHGGVVVAGQATTTTATTPTEGLAREEFASIPDPDNPARTIIVHAA